MGILEVTSNHLEKMPDASNQNLVPSFILFLTLYFMNNVFIFIFLLFLNHRYFQLRYGPSPDYYYFHSISFFK